MATYRLTKDCVIVLQVLVVPATAPPSPVRPGPVPHGAGGEWHVAWTAQVYGLGTMWGVLAVFCLLAAIWVNSSLMPRVHFMMLVALLLALAAANSVSLFYDVLHERPHHPHHPDAAPPAPAPPPPAGRVPQLLADLTLPFLPAAFSVFFFVVLRVSTLSPPSWVNET